MPELSPREKWDWACIHCRIQDNPFFHLNPGYRINKIFKKAVKSGINDPPLSLAREDPILMERPRLRPFNIRKKGKPRKDTPIPEDVKPLFELVDYFFKHEMDDEDVSEMIRSWSLSQKEDFLAGAAKWCPDHLPKLPTSYRKLSTSYENFQTL